jgi:hypothetical protein
MGGDAVTNGREQPPAKPAIYASGLNFKTGTEFDNRWGAMELHRYRSIRADGFTPDSDGPNERDQDPDEAPETPLDEPRPPRVQDPPPQPDEKGPYVVTPDCR